MYRNRITRKNPTAVVILIDQSGSMAEKTLFAGRELSKAEAVASIVNMLISELINRSRREEGIRDYFDVAVYGYSGSGVRSLLPYPKKNIVTLSKLAEMVLRTDEEKIERRLPDGTGSLSVVTKKIWIEPMADGSTPMLEAFGKALKLLTKWCSDRTHRQSYPPTVFNITDGEATDGSPEELASAAEKIKSLSTEGGNALMVNIHLSSHFGTEPVIFPDSTARLPHDRYAWLLYEMASLLPRPYSKAMGMNSSDECRTMSYNTSMHDLLNIMNIGSISLNTID